MATTGSSEGLVIFFWVAIMVLSLSCSILLLLILYRELFCIILFVILINQSSVSKLDLFLNSRAQNQLVINFRQGLHHFGCQGVGILEFHHAHRLFILVNAGNGASLVVNAVL